MGHVFSPEEELLQEVLFEEGPIKEIILHNDDVNTFQHVILSLMDVCDHEPMQATQCAYIVHNNGKCAVKRGTFDRLEPMCTALLERGLSADIE
jgi:ATP-dependent Clp protease adaptor protein ClpS